MLSVAALAHLIRATTAACLLLVVAACAQTSADAPAQIRLAADDVLERSRTAIAGVESYRFTGEWELEGGPSAQRWIRSGEWAAPDRYRLQFEGIDQTAGQGQELVVINGEGYFRPAGRERWVALEVSPSTQADATGAAIPDLGEVRFIGESQPDENGLYHVAGTAGTGGAGPATTYRLSIRSADFLPEEIVIETPDARFDPASGTVQAVPERVQRLVVRYHDFDTPVIIEAPAQIKGLDSNESGRVTRADGTSG